MPEAVSGRERLAPGLYLVATPIGNLEDITLRGLRILKEADRVLCEDTRHTSRLLIAHGIRANNLESYHLHNEWSKVSKVIRLLKGGESIALISDAGTPAINDPGAVIVAAAIEEGVRIIPVPGPTASVTALIASGLSTSEFFFGGFVEAKSHARKKQFQRLDHFGVTLVLFCSPHCLVRALRDAEQVFGFDRRVSLAREVTKVHEEHFRGTVADALLEFSEKRDPRGEFTLIIEGRSSPQLGENASDEEILSYLEKHVALGSSPSKAARQIADNLGIKKSRVYTLSLQLPRKKGVNI